MSRRIERNDGPATSMKSLEEAFLIGVEGATEIWLVRHADCYAGLTDPSDPGLSPLGFKQAGSLGERARRVGMAAVYSSPSRRAVETAQAISDQISIDSRLREFDSEAGAAPKIALNPWMSFSEPPDRVIGRMADAVDEAVEKHSGERVVMVSHGGAILAYLCHVLRLEFGRLRLLPLYTSVSIVRAKGERRMVGTLTDTSHLEGAAG